MKQNPLGNDGATALAAALVPYLMDREERTIIAMLQAVLQSSEKLEVMQSLSNSRGESQDTKLHLNLSGCDVGAVGVTSLSQALYADALLHWVETATQGDQLHSFFSVSAPCCPPQAAACLSQVLIKAMGLLYGSAPFFAYSVVASTPSVQRGTAQGPPYAPSQPAPLSAPTQLESQPHHCWWGGCPCFRHSGAPIASPLFS